MFCPSSLGKVALIGPGAVGVLRGMLALSGIDVRFLMRVLTTVLSDGLWLVHHAEDGRREPVDPLRIHSDPSSIGACDWIIIAGKTTANDDIPELIRPLISENTNFLTLQNGMGNVENIARAYGEHRVILAGLCFTCINRTSPNVIESLLPGYVQFGRFAGTIDPASETMVRAFESAGVRCRRADSLDEALWRKLCWNIPFNGLAIAGGGITTDLILADPNLRLRAEKLMNEIQAGAKACGILIEDSFLQRQFDLTEPMGAYKPSSLIDFLARKPVEVEAIWGEPYRRGLSKGVGMPELKSLLEELHSLTAA